MFRKIIVGLLATTLLSTPTFAQNATSGSPRVQGVPAGYGDPVQVTIRNTDGSAPGAMGSVTVSSSALPTGAATAAAQSTSATTLGTIATNTTSIATAANQSSELTLVGAVTETAPATDTASSGINGRQQRIAQRLTTINTTLGIPFQAGGSIGNTTFAATQSGTWNIGSITTLPALPANQSSNIAQINAVTPLMGNGVTGTGSLRVTLASDTTSNTNPLLFNQSQVNGVAVATGNGVVGTGVQRVAIASDNTAFATNASQINGVTPLMGNGVTGTGSLRVTLASDTTSNTNPLLINQSQVNGVAMLAGNGITGTGSQRVTIASDNTAFTVNAAQATASSLNAQVVGNIASAATDSGNPVKVGGVYLPAYTPLTTGQRADLRMDSQGRVIVTLGLADNSAAIQADVNNADAVAPNAAANKLQTLSLGYAFDGTNWNRVRGDTNAISVLPGISSTQWSYSNGATGILSNTTTAVTIKTAAGASVRNYIDSCQINTTAFTTSVPIAIRDGAGGTVLWALNVPTTGFLQPVTIDFQMPLRGTANTLLEVVTTTADTAGTSWVNCQGHTGA